jgi:hypothetical protein
VPQSSEPSWQNTASHSPHGEQTQRMKRSLFILCRFPRRAPGCPIIVHVKRFVRLVWTSHCPCGVPSCKMMSFASPAGPDAPFSAKGDPELAMTPNGQLGTLRPVVVDTSGDEIHDALVTQQTMISTFCQLSSPNCVTGHSSVWPRPLSTCSCAQLQRSALL